MVFRHYCMYRSSKIVRVIKSSTLRWAGHSQNGRGQDAFKILMGKPLGKRPLGRPKRRWEGNVRMGLKVAKARNWIDSAQEMDYWGALVNAAFNIRVP